MAGPEALGIITLPGLPLCWESSLPPAHDKVDRVVSCWNLVVLLLTNKLTKHALSIAVDWYKYVDWFYKSI